VTLGLKKLHNGACDATPEPAAWRTRGLLRAAVGSVPLNADGEEQRSHAWITAVARARAPRVAVAVMLKVVNATISAGTSGTLAGPVAKLILDAAPPIKTND
jgi:cell division protein FtsI/penicillin-binding protein 2